MTMVIGLTGGIGSGKTTVANLFSNSGIPVYIADDASRKILDRPQNQKQVIEVFGSQIAPSGTIDRKRLADVVFNNPEKLARLNEIIHPAVRKDFADWLDAHRSYPAIVREAAILFESGAYLDCDVIITVFAPLETRIERVTRRDGVYRESVLKRVENQWTDEQREAKSDYVITNVDRPETERQFNEILKKLHIF